MSRLFLDEQPDKAGLFETPEYGGVNTVGYFSYWDSLCLTHVVITPDGRRRSWMDITQFLDAPLEFGNRDQIDALKAWAVCSAYVTERCPLDSFM